MQRSVRTILQPLPNEILSGFAVQPTYETLTILRLSFLLVFGFYVFFFDFVYGLSADSDILI